MIEVCKVYFGPGEAQLMVKAIDGDEVTVVSLSSLRESKLTLAEMEAWRLGSARRTYHPEDYQERRIKRATGTAQEIGKQLNPGDDPAQIWVRYALAERPGTMIDVPQADWLAWRNALPDGA